MRINKNHWLATLPIAHRGLFNDETPENTARAFECAVKEGFAIETDLRLTIDEEVVVFHDKDIARATNGENTSSISSMTTRGLKAINIYGKPNNIITLKELLEIVNGQVPLLLEFKVNSKGVSKLANAAMKLLDNYNGDYAIECFNPLMVRWFKRHRPKVLRGQLSSYFEQSQMKFFKRLLLKKMMFNKRNHPDFVSYQAENLPNKYVSNYVKITNGIVIAWTVTSFEQWETVKPFCDNIIFQDFNPKSI